MREMKPTDIDWIPEMPVTWNEVPNRVLMWKKKVINPIYDGEDILSLTMDGVIVRDLDAGGKMPTSFDGYQKIEAGNLLMCLFDYDVTPRCIGLIEQNGVTSPAYSQYVMSDLAYAKYYYYYYLMVDNTKELLHLAKNMRHSFSEEDFGRIKAPIPPMEEQHSISAYLDAKCAEIDALTADIQTQIDTLEQYKRSVITEAVTKGLNKNVEMKESGIEWIGDIPSAWATMPIKYNFTLVAGATPDSHNPDLWDGDVNWITPADFKTEDVYVKEGSRKLSEIGFKSCSTSMIPAGSIIFSKRAPIGTVAINTTELCTNQGCLGLVKKSRGLDNKYYYYVLSIYPEVFNLFGSGTTFKEISATAFGEVSLPFPPVNEQHRISTYLDAKCSEIDAVVETKKSQLATLDEYKKSNIYEYVTGKKEVPSV